MSDQQVYVPTPLEKARQDFVLGIKFLANGIAQQRVRDVYRHDVLPQAERRLGHAPTTRREVERDLARTTAFRSWAVLTHRSQGMMWDAIEATTQRVAPQAVSQLASLRTAPAKRGSLELDPALEIPTPISNTEIHRQPGGFVGSADPDDLVPGLRYIGASLIYAVGKGQAKAASDGRAHNLLSQLQARFPDFRPRRILDLGCGVGVHSQAIALAFPEAEYHGVDVAAGLLRFGHLIAEQRGLPIHFHQRDASRTGFEAASFDLVLSNILFHETNSARLPQILRECRRVLKPGGVMLHADVATQTSRLELDDQVMNDWQVRWNGEPFWTGYAERDMHKEMIAAGFASEQCFTEYVTHGKSVGFVFGASV